MQKMRQFLVYSILFLSFAFVVCGNQQSAICVKYQAESACKVCAVRGELNCHNCASKDGGCLDPYMDDDSDSCGRKDTHCLKLTTVSQLYDSGSILGKPRETTVVTRGCIRRDGYSDQCRFIESASSRMIWCICASENCNGAALIASNTIFLLLSALLARTVF